MHIDEIIKRIDSDCFITSDEHFNHTKLFDYQSQRKIWMTQDGFNTEGLYPEDLNKLHTEWIIYKFNKVVSENDTTLFLGDFAFSNISVVKRLNGTKILILGNHDKKGPNVYNDFDYVIRGSNVVINDQVHTHTSEDKLYSVLTKVIDGVRCIFSHYPPTTKEYRFKDDVPARINNRIDKLIDLKEYYSDSETACFHGHTHNKVYDEFHNVCLDNNEGNIKRIWYYLGVVK